MAIVSTESRSSQVTKAKLPFLPQPRSVMISVTQFSHTVQSHLLGDVLQHLLGYNNSLFSVKWAPGLRECSLDTALSGPTAFPSTCVALPSWLRPLLHGGMGDNPKASGQSERPHCSGWLLRLSALFQSSDLWGTVLSGRLTQI